MKVSDYEVNTTTTCHFKDAATGDHLGISFSGYVPDSNEWKDESERLLKRKAKKVQEFEFAKGSGNQIVKIKDEEAKIADENQTLLYARMITKVTGFDDLDADENSLVKFFNNPRLNHLSDQWKKWIGDRKKWAGVNFTNAGKTPANSVENTSSTTPMQDAMD